MKPSQTVLLLVLVVVLVFAVTFASMYVAQNKQTNVPKKDGGAKETAGHLNFPQKAYPADKEDHSQRVVTEYGTKGSRDFWFENAHSGAVRVGLNSRNCTCSDVVLYVAPESWRPLVDRVLATRAVAGTTGTFPALLTAVSAEQWAADLTANAEKGHDLSEKEEPSVAAGAFGFVRLRWRADRRSGMPVRPELLKANLWMQNPVGGGNVDLEAGALLVEALRVDTREINVGTLGPGEKKQDVIRVWSTTRALLQEPTIESTGAPFIICGKPEPLTKQEMESLSGGGPVRSGYRMTVEVREQLPNGERIDEGQFVHKVKVRPRDDINLAEPIDVVVQGVVQGEVTLVGAGNGINLGDFSVRNGKTQQITLQTERTDLTLAVEKFSPFLKATLGNPVTESGLKTWTLTVEIGPNKVSGSFPRANVEAYSDSAIYLKVDGSVKRRLRIPVKGNATQ